MNQHNPHQPGSTPPPFGGHPQQPPHGHQPGPTPPFGAPPPSPYDQGHGAYPGYPQGMQVPGSFGVPPQVQALAKSHRLMIRAFFLNLLLALGAFAILIALSGGTSPNDALAGSALMVLSLYAVVAVGITIAFLVGYFKTAAALDQLGLYLILFIVGLFIPFVSLIALILLAMAGTQRLKQYGLNVRFLGVSKNDVP